MAFLSHGELGVAVGAPHGPAPPWACGPRSPFDFPQGERPLSAPSPLDSGFRRKDARGAGPQLLVAEGWESRCGGTGDSRIAPTDPHPKPSPSRGRDFGASRGARRRLWLCRGRGSGWLGGLPGLGLAALGGGVVRGGRGRWRLVCLLTAMSSGAMPRVLSAGRADAEAAGDRRGLGVVRDGVSIDEDVDGAEGGLCLSTGEAGGAEVDEKEVVVGAAGDDSEALRR